MEQHCCVLAVLLLCSSTEETGRAHHGHVPAGLFQENLHWDPHVCGYIPEAPDGSAGVAERWDCRIVISLRLERCEGVALGTGVLQ